MIQLSRIATIVPGVVTPVMPDVPLRRYALVDRGSYEYAEVDAPDFVADLASEVTGRKLAVASSRLLRLSPGDYLLAHHDHVHEDHVVEVMVDLSPAPVVGAEVRYQRGGRCSSRSRASRARPRSSSARRGRGATTAT